MFHSLDLYRRLIGVQIRSQMQYKTSFVMEILGTGLIALLEYASLALVFSQFGTLKGWTLGQVAFLYGLAEFSFGIMDLLFSGFDPGYFGLRIRMGSLDQILLRPNSVTLQVLGSEFALRRFGKIIVGAIIIITAINMTSIAWNTEKIILTFLTVLGQILFFGSLFIIGSAITFWTVESIEVMNIFTYGGSYMISHPMHIYPDLLRRFFTYIVPVIFISYFPVLHILELPSQFEIPHWVPYLAPVIGMVFITVALFFWSYGIKHYQSTGT